MSIADAPLAAQRPGRSQRRFMYVAQRLLEAIHSGGFAPGGVLPADRALAVEFGVSRPTVREALLALELLGVVEIRHGSGVYVCDQSLAGSASGRKTWFDTSTRALFEARTAVEPKLARLCALRMAKSDIRRLAGTVARAQKAVDRNAPYTEFITLQFEFHQLLSDGGGSPVLADINVHLMSIEEHPLWALLNQNILRTRDQRQRQVDEHVVIMNHIKKRDDEAAATAMRDHIADLGCRVIGTDWMI